MAHLDGFDVSPIGGSEDWSVRITHELSGRQAFVIDCGGGYEVCRSLEAYRATGNALARHDDYSAAVRDAKRVVSKGVVINEANWARTCERH